MLEKILEDINSNLVRIANALENSNLQTKEAEKFFTDTINELRPDTNKTAVSTPISQTPTDVSVVTPVQPVPTQCVKPSTIIQATAIPATPQTESFTQEQLAVAMSNAVSAGKMNVIMEILGKFNVQALTQINPVDYNKLATMLREAGVNV